MARKKEVVLYGDLIYQHRISLKTIIMQLATDYFNKKRGIKDNIYDDSKSFSPPRDHLRELPLTYMAVVNNKEVLEMIRVDEHTAAAMQKKGSKLVQFDPQESIVKKGMLYIDNRFVENTEDGNINETD